MILLCYYVLKQYYLSLVRSETERKEIDEMFNMMREGLLIVSKRTYKKDCSLIYSNKAFRKIAMVSPNANVEQEISNCKNLILCDFEINNGQDAQCNQE